MGEFPAIIAMLPSEASTAILTALLTATCTLVGVWITNKANNRQLRIRLEHERKSRNEEIQRHKLEELYIAAN